MCTGYYLCRNATGEGVVDVKNDLRGERVSGISRYMQRKNILLTMSWDRGLAVWHKLCYGGRGGSCEDRSKRWKDGQDQLIYAVKKHGTHHVMRSRVGSMMWAVLLGEVGSCEPDLRGERMAGISRYMRRKNMVLTMSWDRGSAVWCEPCYGGRGGSCEDWSKRGKDGRDQSIYVAKKHGTHHVMRLRPNNIARAQLLIFYGSVWVM